MAWPQGLTAYYPFAGYRRVLPVRVFLRGDRGDLVAYLLFGCGGKRLSWRRDFLSHHPFASVGIVQREAKGRRPLYLPGRLDFSCIFGGRAHLLSYRWAPNCGAGLPAFGLAGLGRPPNRNLETFHELWVRVTRVTGGNPTAYSKLGVAYLKARKYTRPRSPSPGLAPSHLPRPDPTTAWEWPFCTGQDGGRDPGISVTP